MSPPQTPKTTPSPASLPAASMNQTPSSDSQLETLCKMMCGEGLRRHIASKLGETNNNLREQLPKALTLAPNASKLVLSSLENFSHTLSTTSDASVLVLECFLLMGFDEIDEGVKKEAQKAAVIWKKRLIDGGGINKAREMDARGLLLLIGCFGIPRVFSNEDVRDLLRVSNIREISSALKKSNVLLAKIPEIIEGMLKHKMEVDAVDVVYTFGVEEKYSPCAILSSFLQELKDTLKESKWKSNGSHAVVGEANRKELYAMKSIIECLEGHNIDPCKLIPRFRISDRIMSLEEKIARNKPRREKMVQNRKFHETGLSERFRLREAKRSRILGPEQQRVVNHVDSQRPLLEGGTAGHIYGYSVSPSVLPGPVAGFIPETITGSLAGTGAGVVMGAVGSGITKCTNRPLQAGAYTGFHGGMPVDGQTRQMRNYNDPLYGWQGDAAMHGSSVSHNYSYGPLPPWQGTMGLPNAPVGLGHQTSASNVYQFAHTVPGSVPYQNSGSHAVGAVPSVNYHSSYLYPGYYPQGMQ